MGIMENFVQRLRGAGLRLTTNEIVCALQASQSGEFCVIIENS
jgi:hypothetical protein